MEAPEPLRGRVREGRARPARRPVRDRQSGMVTAETAVTLPVLVLFGMALVWALMATAAQIQCVDAARAGARAAARRGRGGGRAPPPGRTRRRRCSPSPGRPRRTVPG
jgi:hypothetical protein